MRHCRYTQVEIVSPSPKMVLPIRERTKPVSDIFDAVSLATGIKEEIFRSKKRNREISEARHLCQYFVLKYNPKFTLSAVGYLFGTKHATVIWARQHVEDLFKTDKAFREKYMVIQAILEGRATNDA